MDSTDIERYSRAIIKCFMDGGKLLIIGNGGSSSLSQHFATELVGKFKKERRALPALSLDNPSTITAIANDYSFTDVFTRQLEAFGKKGDILVTMSTSGKSENVNRAIETAYGLGLGVISFPTNKRTGYDTAKTQELHLEMIHQISEQVENAFV